MSNAVPSSNVSGSSSSPAQHMGAGTFFGAIHAAREQCGAIFTEVRHACPRKLPKHSHELAFFALVLNGHYRERCGRSEGQYAPFTLMFRPAGVPHQDEIGPRGVRLFEIELRPSWLKRFADFSATLDAPRDELGGGPLIWFALKLFREVEASASRDDLVVESLLAEMLSFAARPAPRDSVHAPGWLSRILEKLQAEHCRRLTLD